MKAIVIYEAGGPEKLIYTDVPTPKVKPGWSLVRVIGRGVNHSEIFTRDGQSPSVKFPRISVDVKPEKVFQLSEMRKAHEYLGSSRSFGKVVVMSE